MSVQCHSSQVGSTRIKLESLNMSHKCDSEPSLNDIHEFEDSADSLAPNEKRRKEAKRNTDDQSMD